MLVYEILEETYLSTIMEFTLYPTILYLENLILTGVVLQHFLMMLGKTFFKIQTIGVVKKYMQQQKVLLQREIPMNIKY
jgi:hypothetical protein